MSEKASSLIRDRIGCIDGWYRTEGGEMRSQLVDAADAAEAIESENAMLRTQLADVTESMGRVEERCAELREQGARLFDKTLELGTENAKLRELVRDYIDAPCTTCDCWQDEFRCWNYDGADCGLVARARELGVEVDG